MATNYRLQDYALLTGKDVFVDANVLIYLFWPTGQYHYEVNYAQAFRNLLRQGNTLYVDFLVISEVVNRVLRIEHQKLNPGISFKAFRNSQDGKNVIRDIYLIIKDQILSLFKVIGKAFNKSDIDALLLVDQLDFIDKAAKAICIENSLVLLTNDMDFKNSGIDILTGNPHILN